MTQHRKTHCVPVLRKSILVSNGLQTKFPFTVFVVHRVNFPALDPHPLSADPIPWIWVDADGFN